MQRQSVKSDRLLGIFTLAPGAFNYIGGLFTLAVTFTLPAGTAHRLSREGSCRLYHLASGDAAFAVAVPG